MTNNKNTYCPAPWHGGYFTYNQQSVCCEYSVVNTTSIVEFYKSDLVSNLKKNIIAGTPPDECNKCFDLEKIGSKSHRQIYLENFKLNDIEFDYDPNSESKPQYIEVRLSNLCNFKCRMCFPTWSSLIGKELEQTPDLAKWYPIHRVADIGHHEYTVEFLDEIIGMIPNLKWINFTGGEPMIIPEVVMLMDKINEQDAGKNISLHFTTNGSVLNPRIISRFENHKYVQLTISLDGIGDVAEYVRHGTVWDKMLKNCDEYGKLNLKLDNMQINFNMSLSSYAALAIDRTVEFVCNFNEKYKCDSTDMNLVEGLLSPLNLKGQARQTAIDAMERALVIIDNYCNTSTIDPRKMKIVGDQINSMQNRMLNSDADNDEWEKFKQFTHDFDAARNESFEQVFGFRLD